MFKKILIANRGEIALRVMRTCREMGIATVAVFSEPDRNAPFVRYADEAHPIGGATPRESYLDIDRLLRAVQASGAEAVHPGYGFLSENPAFAEACAAAGVTFIGPPPSAMVEMGEKTRARRTMVAAGVPVVPGTERSVSGPEEALDFARRAGYPVLLKAAAGGGGKGMRLARSDAELVRGLEAARREAASAFGDEAVYLEKYLVQPRHVEFQILADRHGRVVHLNERECSIQRRHQKIVEECPSPLMDVTLRARMGAVAVHAARSVGYVGAGTIEFLMDADRNFYFLEMNTRLQVEHPITELTTGVDLVRKQIEVAAGLPLDLPDSMAPRGHAIEARIYAEDPDKGFVPCPGRITFLRVPSGIGVRDDSGVCPGYLVSPYYDPMISKLSVWGADRAQAIQRMRRALSEYVVGGITTNLGFLRRVLDHPLFQEGSYDTHFVESAVRDVPGEGDDGLREAALLAAAVATYRRQVRGADLSREPEGGAGESPWKMAGRRWAMRG